MDPRLRSRIEIETIHELLPELDFYRLLGLKQGCAQSDIESAFRAESRRLHPDRHTAGATPEFRSKANEVFKAISEAYRTLKDPDARAAYDQQFKPGEKKLVDDARKAADADAQARMDPSKAARTPKGEKYWKMALQCWSDKDFKGCVMQINFALTFEPDNAIFKEWLAKAKTAQEENKSKTQAAGYRIRLS